MAKTVIIDELRLTLRVPGNRSDAETEAIRLALDGDAFADRLRRAVRAALRSSPELAAVRVSLTR